MRGHDAVPSVGVDGWEVACLTAATNLVCTLKLVLLAVHDVAHIGVAANVLERSEEGAPRFVCDKASGCVNEDSIVHQIRELILKTLQRSNDHIRFTQDGGLSRDEVDNPSKDLHDNTHLELKVMQVATLKSIRTQQWTTMVRL